MKRHQKPAASPLPPFKELNQPIDVVLLHARFTKRARQQTGHQNLRPVQVDNIPLPLLHQPSEPVLDHIVLGVTVERAHQQKQPWVPLSGGVYIIWDQNSHAGVNSSEFLVLPFRCLFQFWEPLSETRSLPDQSSSHYAMQTTFCQLQPASERDLFRLQQPFDLLHLMDKQIGRASCREGQSRSAGSGV